MYFPYNRVVRIKTLNGYSISVVRGAATSEGANGDSFDAIQMVEQSSLYIVTY